MVKSSTRTTFLSVRQKTVSSAELSKPHNYHMVPTAKCKREDEPKIFIVSEKAFIISSQRIKILFCSKCS